MKILFLTSRFPYPPHRGDKLKIFNIIKQLKMRGHEITLLSFISSTKEYEYIPDIKKYCKDVYIVYLHPIKSLFNCMLGTISKLPFQIYYYKSKRFKKLLNTLLDNNEYHIIHTHLIRMAQYTHNLNSNVVLDLTDAGSLYLQRFYNNTYNILLKYLLKIEITRLKKYENIINSFRLAMVCSDVDREYLLDQSPNAKIKILYNGIDSDYFINREETIPDKHRLIFTGNMTYFPNIDGAIYFAKEILPLISKKIPKIKLFIVGKNPPKKIKKLENEQITVTGFVEDIKEEYLKSKIAISPIRFGAGTLNKILEPMALGIPVVSTKIGVEGLPFRNGEDLIIADTPEDFANGVINLLNNDDLYRKIAANASMVVHSLYSWNKITKSLEEYYQSIIENNLDSNKL